MTQYTKYTFFYSSKNPFSNHYICKFKDDFGIEYSSLEQWMMAEKARVFEDYESQLKIMETDNPNEQKDLGRKVKNFNAAEWEAVAQDIVYEGLKLKFTQNPDLLKFMNETHGTLLVEAALDDKIWGIGMAENDPAIKDPANWKGKNLLGQLLTKLRDNLSQSIS